MNMIVFPFPSFHIAHLFCAFPPTFTIISWAFSTGYSTQWVVSLKVTHFWVFTLIYPDFPSQTWPDVLQPIHILVPLSDWKALLAVTRESFCSFQTHPVGISPGSWDPASLPHSIWWGPGTLSDLATMKTQPISRNPV